MNDNEAPFGGDLAQYHAHYRRHPRERDKAGLRILEDIREEFSGTVRIVDIGAGWGSYAYHIRNEIRDCEVSAIELDEACIQSYKTEPDLKGINAIFADIMAAQVTESWDIASTVAVTCVYPQAQFEQMISAISGLISPGGYYIGWEMIHGVDQELEIKETHADISDILCIRSTKNVSTVFEGAGFSAIRFIPFEMPFDMEPVKSAVKWSGKATDIRMAHLKSHTIKTDNGRLSFRGAMYQPWCHVIAQKL